ncbi:MAG: putative lipid II flippase FtsW, partial [bacterium]
ISIVMMFVTAFFDYRYFRKFAWIILGGAVVLLLLVLIPGVGVKVNGARRWLGFGFFRLHIGEVAKLALIIFFAVMLDKAKENIQKIKTVGIFMCILGGIALLILMEPDFGMTGIIGVISLAMMYIAGAKKRHLGGIAVLGACGAVMLVLLEPYRMRRMMGFMNLKETASNEGYQTMQSLIAFGNGRFFGKGLGESTQKLMYLPEQHTDFIFSIVGEELGILGLLLVVSLFVYLTYRGLYIARKCEDPLATYLVFGIIFMISAQAFLNMGVALGMLPVTGLTLPFISFGGSSLMFTYMGIGIILNISMNSMATAKRRGYEEHSSGGWGHRGPSIPGDRPRPTSTRG